MAKKTYLFQISHYKNRNSNSKLHYADEAIIGNFDANKQEKEENPQMC